MSENEVKKSMELEYQETEPCVWKVNLKVPQADLAKEMQETLKEFSKYAEVPGFRKGKCPAALIKNRFKDKIEEELVKRFYSSGYEKINEDEKLDIISFDMPEENPKKLNMDEDFEFSMNFNVAPDFELPEYKEMKVEVAPADKKGDDQIQERLDYYRQVYAEYKTVDSAAEKEDMLKVSYESDFEVSDDAPETLRRQVVAEESWLWLNEPEIIPGAIEGLTGVTKDEERSLEAKYPEDYRIQELSGVTVNYKIKVMEIQRKVPSESDEALCEKMRVDDIETLKNNIRQQLEMENEQRKTQEAREKVYNELNEKIDDFPLPKGVMESESLKQLRGIANKVVKSEEDAASFKENKEQHQKEADDLAKERLRRYFIFRKIAKIENIQLEPEEVKQQIRGLSQQYGYKEKDFVNMMEKSGTMDDMQIDMLMAKVTDFLVDKAKVEEVAK